MSQRHVDDADAQALSADPQPEVDGVRVPREIVLLAERMTVQQSPRDHEKHLIDAVDRRWPCRRLARKDDAIAEASKKATPWRNSSRTEQPDGLVFGEHASRLLERF